LLVLVVAVVVEQVLWAHLFQRVLLLPQALVVMV
jgi:hypothetical protein